MRGDLLQLYCGYNTRENFGDSSSVRKEGGSQAGMAFQEMPTRVIIGHVIGYMLEYQSQVQCGRSLEDESKDQGSRVGFEGVGGCS